MARPVVLLAVRMDGERRRIAAERLGGLTEVLVRSDLSDAELARRGARPFRPPPPGGPPPPPPPPPAAVTVCSNAGAYGVSIGEHAMALLLAAAKNVVAHTDAIRAGKFSQDVLGKAVHGKTLGVVGLGGIGGEAARLAAGLGMRVVGINRRGRTDAPVAWCGTLADLDRLLGESEFVLLSIPLTRATADLIGARELGLMKPDAILVNIARGGLVRERDLYEHLRANPRFQAALDVWWTYPKGDGFPFTEPFHELPNVVKTPHVAWAIPEQSRWSLEAALDNVARFLRGGPPRNVVDRAEYRFGEG